MSALLTAPPQPALFESGRQGPTLDDVVAGAWDALRAGATVACPACGDELHPRHSAGAGVVGGRCEGCGAALS